MYEFLVDVNGAYRHKTEEDIARYGGVIPSWFSSRPTLDTKSVREIIEHEYIWPLEIELMGTVGENLQFLCPGDPPIDPVIIINNLFTGECVIIYTHGICALREQTGERDEYGQMGFTYKCYRID